MNKFFPVFQM